MPIGHFNLLIASFGLGVTFEKSYLIPWVEFFKYMNIGERFMLLVSLLKE